MQITLARFILWVISISPNLSINIRFVVFVACFIALEILCCSRRGSAIALRFNGAETNCRIAHVLGILLMISY